MMGPFCSRQGGGCQVMNTVSGSWVVTVTFTGGELGAGERREG